MTGATLTPSASTSCLQIPVTISWEHQQHHPLLAFVDSGAAGNFMDLTLAKRLHLPITNLDCPLMVMALDGRPLGKGKVNQITAPVLMSIEGDHHEKIQFNLIQTPEFPLVLGFPWLSHHSPHINWSSGTVVEWGPSCKSTCLLSRATPLVPKPPSFFELSRVPSEYHSLSEVFSKEAATALPPHRPYDCPIDLIPGFVPPRGRIFSLSPTETQAMEEYIKDSMSAGIIRPSSSPAGAGFFFVEKKDGGLRPCIDYRGLNKGTVRNRYPLPLMSSAFELLQGATVFTKLDLRNAYHLVRIRDGDEWKTAFNTPTGHYEYLVMPFGLTNAPAVFQALINDVLREMLNRSVFVYLDDILIFSKSLHEHVHHVRAVLQRLLDNNLFVKPEKCEFHVSEVSFLGFILSKGSLLMDPKKTQVVREWHQPSSVKEVQRFIGFSNFYRKFIRNFSAVVSPLTNLTKKKLGPFVWTPGAERAFQELKVRFTSAPILTLPDPSLPFLVEVDASDVAVGAILSQRPADGKLHPCAFFSTRLSAAERNYNVGDRELLAIKMALEEWRHWLEGAQHPFIVWTDHKNLEYVQKAKRLNPRQARWALFFNRFDFILSYRPGLKNQKPDALSRLFQKAEDDRVPASILPSSKIVAPV